MDLATLFITITVQLHLPPGLLSAVCYTETKHDPTAIHYNDGGSDSLGICQIKLSTARQFGFKGTPSDLMNPKTNIYYAGRFLRYQLRRYHENAIKAVVAYNKGHANVTGPETCTQYCNKVFGQLRFAINE